MKVTSHDLSGLGAAGAGRTQEAQKNSYSSSEVGYQGGNGDNVNFSSALGSLSRAMSADGADRGARVQALAAQYQSGSYSVNSAAVSRGLMAEAMV
jgi:hypothetical protein